MIINTKYASSIVAAYNFHEIPKQPCKQTLRTIRKIPSPDPLTKQKVRLMIRGLVRAVREARKKKKKSSSKKRWKKRKKTRRGIGFFSTRDRGWSGRSRWSAGWSKIPGCALTNCPRKELKEANERKSKKKKGIGKNRKNIAGVGPSRRRRLRLAAERKRENLQVGGWGDNPWPIWH